MTLVTGYFFSMRITQKLLCRDQEEKEEILIHISISLVSCKKKIRVTS